MRDDFRTIADALAADIAAGRLRAGARLPPQRRFARDRRIAPSTAARVYQELVRRGLVVGEVGRGTFVRGGAPAPEPALAEPAGTAVDLEMNFPAVDEQAALLAGALRPLLTPEVLAAAVRPVGVAGTPRARDLVADLLTRDGWSPDPRHLLFAGNGRQAIAAAIAAQVPFGGRLGVEELTYPVVKALATRLGLSLVPIAMDDDGLLPDALRAAHAATPLHAVYLQPILHNPVGVTMPPRRRAEIADALRDLALPAIEDGIYAFLRDDQSPLAALAPDLVLLVDSLSKRLAPGLSLGFLVPPGALVERVGTAVRSGGWAATGFALAAGTAAIADGTVATVQQGKRRDAAARQAIVRDVLADFDVRAGAGSYHCWWRLPEPWRAETFVAAAARRGIAVTPAAAFAVGRSRSPHAVRLALASPPHTALRGALATLAGLARGTPEDAGME
ncbi:PLP-dependent aminotransferase family protein [Plantactinospora sp. GCM10030261]|uniref:aminotransferase-like domain-containing protein n=1 Tax=Plantactinospora sp. GCM10030261 TaxID=3273420 RepID=UPI003614C116